MTVLVLASASPARLATLRAAGVEPLVIVSGVDETKVADVPPVELALQLAELKCAAVAGRDEVPAGALVLGCDSVLELDGEPFGKPEDAATARERWRTMRGRSGSADGETLEQTSSNSAPSSCITSNLRSARSKARVRISPGRPSKSRNG